MMSSNKPQPGEKTSVRCKVRFVNNDKAVELTREDGNVEFHKLAK